VVVAGVFGAEGGSRGRGGARYVCGLVLQIVILRSVSVGMFGLMHYLLSVCVIYVCLCMFVRLCAAGSK